MEFWYQPLTWRRPWVALLILPMWLFRGVSAFRSFAYRRGLLRQEKLPVPVVIVGNISVGGTGKTPLLLKLAESLQENGLRVGIISRGYGAQRTDFPHLLSSRDLAISVGDEPMLLARRSGCPVVIDPQRARGGRYLLQQADVDIVLSDDGLQHYALRRNFEIVVIDATRGLGNGYCLPLGPLRESAARLQTVNYIVVNGSGGDTSYGRDCANVELAIKRFVRLTDQESVSSVYWEGKLRIHAVAGIGNPQRFFDSLRSLNFDIVEHVFPDHHPYRASDFHFDEDLPIIMTEKDAVKCAGFEIPFDTWFAEADISTASHGYSRLIDKLCRLVTKRTLQG